MSTSDTAPFLQGNPAATSAATAGVNGPYPSRPQKDGSSSQQDGGNDKFPNRPQPMGAPKPNPQSIPNGGTLPYKGPSVPTQTPFKLGK